MARGVHAKALQRAAAIVGGDEALRAALQAEPAAFERWKRGEEDMPQEVFLRIVDIIVDTEVRSLHGKPH